MAESGKKGNPWDFLAEFKGTVFKGEWPTVPQMFEITYKRYPDNRCFTAFAPSELTLTYTQAREKVLQVADYLVGLGVGPESKVAVSGKNSPEWAVAYLATLYTGATVVPLDYQLTDKEIDFLMTFAGVKHLFIDAERIDDIDAKGKVGLEQKPFSVLFLEHARPAAHLLELILSGVYVEQHLGCKPRDIAL